MTQVHIVCPWCRENLGECNSAAYAIMLIYRHWLEARHPVKK